MRQRAKLMSGERVMVNSRYAGELTYTVLEPAARRGQGGRCRVEEVSMLVNMPSEEVPFHDLALEEQRTRLVTLRDRRETHAAKAPMEGVLLGCSCSACGWAEQRTDKRRRKCPKCKVEVSYGPALVAELVG